jgi:hypothetical protein
LFKTLIGAFLIGCSATIPFSVGNAETKGGMQGSPKMRESTSYRFIIWRFGDSSIFTAITREQISKICYVDVQIDDYLLF